VPRNTACERCRLHLTTSNVCIWGNGPKRADIMLIGEAPGAEEEQEGRPFVGAAGRKIDALLAEAGLPRDKVYVSNIVKCRPPNNRDPLKDEAAACFTYLAEEIAQVKPKVIVLIGLQAVKALTSETALGKARGKLLQVSSKVRVGDALVIATYHPAWAMHNPAMLKTMEDGIIEDLRYAQNLVNPSKAKGARKTLADGYTIDELRDALMWLRKARELSCDLEWTAPPKVKFGWPWNGAELLSLSLTGKIEGGLRTVALAWPAREKSAEKVRAMLSAFLRKRPIFNHNIMADAIWLLSKNVEFSINGDTMLLSYLLDENRRAGLKGLAPLVAGVAAGWETKPWHRRPESHAGWQELLDYNADDTENTYKLRDAQVAELVKLAPMRARNIARVYSRLLVPAVKPFAHAALYGLPINRKKLEALRKTYEARRTNAIKHLARLTQLREDKAEELAMSPAKVKDFARAAFGLEIETSREEELGPYAEQYPALKHIKEIKHLSKFLSTYIRPWARMLDRQNDGRLHSIYLLGATRTGRLSADVEEGASALLMPRDFEMRDLVDAEAEDSEYEILTADYSQLELRIAAWLFPEYNMRKLYQAGADLHRTSAAYMVAKAHRPDIDAERFRRNRKKWEARVTKEERQAAKGENFGLLYGMQELHFAAYVEQNYGVKLTPAQAHTTYEEHFKLYDGLRPAHARMIEEANRKGYTLTPFGRYRYEIEATKVINTPIQSTGSDLGVFAFTLIYEDLQRELEAVDAQLIGFVHDAVIVRSKKALREQVSVIIKQNMENPPLQRVGIDEIPVPLVAEVAHGPTWAKAS